MHCTDGPQPRGGVCLRKGRSVCGMQCSACVWGGGREGRCLLGTHHALRAALVASPDARPLRVAAFAIRARLVLAPRACAVAAAAEEAMRISKAKALQAMGVAADKAEEAAAEGATGADGREKRDTARDTEKSTKNGVFQWIALDYGHFADVVRLKLHTLRAKINAQLDVKKADPELVCQSCGHRTSQLDAFADGLMNPETMVFECPHCSGLLLPDGAKGDAADAHRERAEAMRAALADIDKSLVQVVAALIRVRALPAPLFRSLDEWRRAEAAKRGVVTKRGTPGVSRPLEEGVSGLADINIEVDLGDTPADGRLGGPKRPKRALPAFFQQDHSVKRARPASQQPAGFDGANGGAAAQEPVAAGAVEGKAAPAVPAPVAAVGASKAEEDALDRFYAAEEEAKAQAAAAQAAAAHAQEQPAAAAETAGDGADSDSDDGWEEA